MSIRGQAHKFILIVRIQIYLLADIVFIVDFFQNTYIMIIIIVYMMLLIIWFICKLSQVHNPV